jgi:hypothetical protein
MRSLKTVSMAPQCRNPGATILTCVIRSKPPQCRQNGPFGHIIASSHQRLRLVSPRIMVWPPRAPAWDKKRQWGVAKR